MNAINVEKLCKSYGQHEVLHQIDCRVEQGKLVGFLGPNGAGKTTTLRILLGLLKSDSGVVDVFGQDAARFGKQIRAEVGYLPGDVHFYPNLTGRATLKFFAAARRRHATVEIERLAHAFDLDLDKPVRRYSTGMRQKLGLIQALMHKPKLLILDEPTSALDPLVRKSVSDELRNVVTEGRTVLFSSHSLNEVEELCDEVVILRGGKIVEHQSIEILRERALKRVAIIFRGDGQPADSIPQQLQVLKHQNGHLEGTWSGEVQQLLDWLQAYEVDDLTIEKPDLNDLFITYYANGGEQHV
ncbi:MAG: ABC-2 type transport system ATP-binding protein [Mariniblastus sp.]|jgi:ABC-2 type transport system ATP-binding protein